MEMTKGGVPIPQTVDGVERTAPPPTYQEVMNVAQTSVTPGPAVTPVIAVTTPRLTHIDIMPQCIDVGNWGLKQPPTFDTFSEVVRTADTWLQNNTGYQAWRCETFERRVNKGPEGRGLLHYVLDTTLRHEALFGFMVHVRELRLWLTARPPNTPHQQLASFDVIPDVTVVNVPPGLDIEDTFFVVDGRVINYQPQLMTRASEFSTYRGLRATVDKLNSILQNTPLPGTILNIEVVTIKRNYHESLAHDLDPNQSAWDIDGGCQRSTRILRVYYTCGPPAHETVGVQFAVPALTKLSSWLGRHTFQRQFEMTYPVTQCLNQSPGGRLISIQQCDVRYYQKKEQIIVVCDSMDSTSSPNDLYGQDLLKTQTLFYTTSSSAQALTPPSVLASRLFTPIRLGRKRYETLQQTMSRIDYWLRATGLPVYKVETVEPLYVETVELLYVDNDEQGINTDTSSYCLKPLKSHNWVTCIRLYFPQQFQEPSPYALPQALDWKSQVNPSGTCSLL